ncbi:GDP-L-fucose synthase [Candidatus Dependentiae bacterium Noda2021]|nr:GDP-L-fucose synthase [Candidatus Dependentiae bacterium Noda2021]
MKKLLVSLVLLTLFAVVECNQQSSPMAKDARIFVAGHRGLVGSHIVDELHAQGYTNVITKTKDELDLCNAQAVDNFFNHEKPEYVFLSAAKVGGILANNTYPADFIAQNLSIELNVIQAAHKYKVKKLLFLGSSCIYPRMCPQPIKEEYLLTSELEPTNEPYAIAKIAGIKLCQSYNRQHGTKFIACMPTNLYGPRDNFNLQNSHVLPALMAKIHAAKVNGDTSVTVWGTGTPRREFLYVADLAQACVFLMNTYEGNDVVNVGTGVDVTIAELVSIISKVVGFEGELIYDTSKPDGTPRKLLNVDRLSVMGWKAQTDLEDGVRAMYEWYLKNYSN